jgi:rsbT co-antagonist protein RsbR
MTAKDCDVTIDARGRLSLLLSGHAEQILKDWVDLAATQLRDRMTRSELERELGALLEAIRAGLDGLDADTPAAASAEPFDTARGLLAELSHTRARRNFTPTETCVAVFALKDAVLTALGDQADGHPEIFRLFALIDQFGVYTFETYAGAREQIIIDQSEQLLELSTPVVKLWDGILAVPLVGTLDSARTQVVMEKLLQSLVDTGSEHAIIDITGVPAVDTQVAQHLLKTVMAARLMGAECIISGIRPQIAQTIVALGIEFGDIRTKATLADALIAALRTSGRGRPDASTGA